MKYSYIVCISAVLVWWIDRVTSLKDTITVVFVPIALIDIKYNIFSINVPKALSVLQRLNLYLKGNHRF